MYSAVLDIKGSLFLLKGKLLSKYESETSVLVNLTIECTDVLFNYKRNINKKMAD